MRRLIGLLAMTAVLALGGMMFAGVALAQTTTTAPTLGSRAPGAAGTTATTAGLTTATTARSVTTPTTARSTTATTARAGTGSPTQARTGARTDTELGLAGGAFLIGGALLFFGQPLRRIRDRV